MNFDGLSLLNTTKSKSYLLAEQEKRRKPTHVLQIQKFSPMSNEITVCMLSKASSSIQEVDGFGWLGLCLAHKSHGTSIVRKLICKAMIHTY